jgi:hypothetical protein
MGWPLIFGSVIARRWNRSGRVRSGDEGLIVGVECERVGLVCGVGFGVKLSIERLTGEFE